MKYFRKEVIRRLKILKNFKDLKVLIDLFVNYISIKEFKKFFKEDFNEVYNKVYNEVYNKVYNEVYNEILNMNNIRDINSF